MSECTLVKMSHFWKSHVTAQIINWTIIYINGIATITQLPMCVMKIVHIQGNSHSLDPDQDQQKVVSDLDPNRLTLTMIAFLKESSVDQLFAKIVSGFQKSPVPYV